MRALSTIHKMVDELEVILLRVIVIVHLLRHF